MIEHGMYFGKSEFYQIIRDNGGSWNDSKERPIICLIKSTECDNLYWAIPVGNYEHRNEQAKERIQKFIQYNKKDIRSCFYHIGNTNEKSIFFISDVVPITDKYIDREYLNQSKKIHIVKNKVLLADLEYKLRSYGREKVYKLDLEGEAVAYNALTGAFYKHEFSSDKEIDISLTARGSWKHDEFGRQVRRELKKALSYEK